LLAGAAGSIPYQTASSATTFLAIGTNGYVLTSNGSAPYWAVSSGGPGGASTSTNTVLQTANASYYPTFVDSNNSSAAGELFYTTSSFVINPQSGRVGIGTTSPGSRLEIKYGVQGALTLPLTINPGFYQSGSSTGIGFLTDGDTTYTKGALVYTSNGTGWNIGDFQFLMRNDNNTNPVTLSDAVMTIYRNGNVGIGNTSPAQKLEVAGSSQTVSTFVRIANNQGSITNNNVGSALQFYGWDAGITANIKSFREGQSYSPSYLSFETYGGNSVYGANTLAERMRIDGYGNVFVATTAQLNTGFTHKLTVNGSIVSGSSASTNGTIMLQGYYGSNGALTNFGTEYSSGGPSIGYACYPSNAGAGAFFSSYNAGAIGRAAMNMGDSVKWYTGSSQNVAIGSALTMSEKMRLSNAGGLSVGTASDGVAGEIRASNEITAYYSSDINLKENIKLIVDPLGKLEQIRGVSYDWKDEHIQQRGGEDGYFVRKHDIGVIAQEVEAVLPEIVATRDDGTKVVKYEKLVALLIEAVKDQQRQINQISQALQNMAIK
jgi:hypothetical protein